MNNSEKTILSARGIGKTVQSGSSDLVILREIDLSVTAGDAVAVVGASGSGKSTLLAILAGLDTPTAGTVEVDGADLFGLNEDARAELRGRLVGFVFQSFQLLPSLSALENVMLPAELAGDGGRDARARAQGLLDRMGLGARLAHRPDELSGGEAQRVAIARALMRDPPIVLADEPTGNLDSASGKEVLDLLRGAVDARRTVLLVTHDASIAKQGERTLTMADGRLVSDARSGPSARL